MSLPDVEGIATAFGELSAEKEKYLFRSIIRRRLLEQAIDLLTRQGEPVDGSEWAKYLKETRDHLAGKHE